MLTYILIGILLCCILGCLIYKFFFKNYEPENIHNLYLQLFQTSNESSKNILLLLSEDVIPKNRKLFVETLLENIKYARENLAQETGIIYPIVSIKDYKAIKNDYYEISYDNQLLLKGIYFKDKTIIPESELNIDTSCFPNGTISYYNREAEKFYIFENSKIKAFLRKHKLKSKKIKTYTTNEFMLEELKIAVTNNIELFIDYDYLLKYFYADSIGTYQKIPLLDFHFFLNFSYYNNKGYFRVLKFYFLKPIIIALVKSGFSIANKIETIERISSIIAEFDYVSENNIDEVINKVVNHANQTEVILLK